jgi:hypothetical protein
VNVQSAETETDDAIVAVATARRAKEYIIFFSVGVCVAQCARENRWTDTVRDGRMDVYTCESEREKRGKSTPQRGGSAWWKWCMFAYGGRGRDRSTMAEPEKYCYFGNCTEPFLHLK